MGNVVETLETWAAKSPERTLFAFLNTRGKITNSYTYREFHLRTNHLASVLATTGDVRPGEPVLLLYQPGLEFAAAFYAAAKLGAIPVPAPPPVSSNTQVGLAKLAHVIADSGASVVLTEKRLRDRLHGTVLGDNIDFSLLGMERTSSSAWYATDEIRGEIETFAANPCSTLFLQYTSGSTREPRGVAVTQANIIHNGQLALNHDHPIGVSWLPHFHDMGLIGYFLWAALRGGSSYCFSPLDFLRRPVLWLETITKFKATITTAPNFAFDYCLREDKVPANRLETFDLSSLRQLVNAAEPVRSASVNRFVDRFARCGLDRRAVTAAFGLAEHTLCVTGGGRVHIDVNKRLIERNQLRVETGSEFPSRLLRLVSCGKPDRSVDLRIVEPISRRQKAPGEIGEIWVDSPSKADGYWGKPQLSQDVFRAQITGRPHPPGYLRTGDMGFLHDGELFVCGRLKDMIVVRGQNIYPNDVEAFIEANIAGVVLGSVVVFGITSDNTCEGVGILIEAKGNAPLPKLADIAEEVAGGAQVPVRLAALVSRGSIARTSSGKISRSATEERWRTGQIELIDMHEPAPDAKPPKSASDYLEELFRLAEARGDETLTLEELGLDSFELVTLSLHLEEFVENNRLGNGHLTSDVNDLRVMQSISVAQLRALLAEAVSSAPDADRLNHMSAEAVQAVLSAEERIMQKDALLPDTLSFDTCSALPERGGMLVTGATGFLGTHLLAALFRQCDETIHVLVRAQDAEHGRNRIEAALSGAGYVDMVRQDELWSRVVVVPGDLAQTRLGLDAPCWSALAQNVTSIYHCGAEVDYVRSYRAMRDANVGGTCEVLRLCADGVKKRLHHMSTTFVFGWCAMPQLLEDPYPGGMKDRDFGYAQTKWVAEQLVYQAKDRGLDASIYRSSLVTASDSGHYVRSDIVARVLGYMIRHGLSTSAQNQMSFLPVDHCAGNIAAISLCDEVDPATFHVTADQHYTIGHVCDVIAARFGYQFGQTDMDGFADHMHHHCGPDDELFPLKPFITRHVERVNRMQDKRYDNRNYRQARQRAGGAMPEPPLEETVEAIVRFLQADGLVPAAGTATNERLSGA